MTGLLATLRAHAAASPAAVAIDPLTGPAVSWASLVRRVEDATRLFADLPRQVPHDLSLDHGLDSCVLELGALEAGVPVLSLPAFFTAEQAAHSRSACGVAGARTPTPQSAPSSLPGGTARITFTSGSTGTPKGICLSARHMLSVAGSIVAALGPEHAGRHLAVLPPGVLLETVAGFFATMLAGGTYVCPPQAAIGMADPFRPNFAALARTVAEARITSLILVPEYLAGLVAAMEASGLALPDLTLVAVGGARVPVALLARARALGLPVRQGYGLTECASVVSLETGDEPEAGSVGRPLGHVAASIAADGEILLAGEMFLGTISEPRAPGPLATGDVGRIDAEGRLWIEGRKSAVFVTGYGRNVSPEWVEAALLAQPGVLQAKVHGEGLALPEALIVPAAPDADLAAAVAAANATLPAYARVARWQEVAPFTPGNGQLTGNGRLRRKAIAAAWLEREPTVFDRLEAATFRDRLRFLQVPQVRAGLAGEITLRAYRDYLAQAYHHVRHTVPLMRAARARLLDRPALVAALDAYIAEETGHEEWILADIAAAGGHAELVRRSAPHPATQAMVAHAYERIANDNPAGLLGMIYVLESVSVALASRGAGAVAERLGLPPEAFTYLTSHGALDAQHMAFFAGLVNGLEGEADRAAILAMARAIFALYGAVFASVTLDDAEAGVAAA